MKKFILGICIFFPSLIQGQDRFGVTFDASFSLSTIRMNSTMDVNVSSNVIIDQWSVPKNPVYRKVDTLGMVSNGTIHLGLNIPVIKKTNWSAGFRISGGLGAIRNIKAAEGMEGLILDFPAYAYFRTYKSTDASFLLGFKYSMTALPARHLVMGVDLGVDETSFFRFYFTPLSSNYYTTYTNGKIYPSIKIREFGLGFILGF